MTLEIFSYVYGDVRLWIDLPLGWDINAPGNWNRIKKKIAVIPCSTSDSSFTLEGPNG